MKKLRLEARIGKTLGHFTVTEGAKGYILAILANEKSYIRHVGVGTNSPSDTTLGEEVGRRGILEVLEGASGTTERTWRSFFESDYPSTDNIITEIGLFGNSSSTKDSGVLVASATLTQTILKRTGIDSLWVEYKLYYG